eukprot:11168478-Alexandrium_andersonii.AAC.1
MSPSRFWSSVGLRPMRACCRGSATRPCTWKDVGMRVMCENMSSSCFWSSVRLRSARAWNDVDKRAMCKNMSSSCFWTSV